MQDPFIFEQKLTVIDSARFNGAVFEVCEMAELEGADSPDTAMMLYFAKQQGLKIRFVRIRLNNACIKTEAGALYYYYGNIDCKTHIGGAGGFIKKAISGRLTGESGLKPAYYGNGVIYLEPSFKHYIILSIENDSVIVDKGMFYCCSDTIEIRPVIQKNISSAVLGQEGLFQIALKGSGTAVLESNVPISEIHQITLNPGEELKVDGNFALLRSANIEFSVTTSEKSLIGSALNGEGFLNTFRAVKGDGFVWIAPTSPLYKKISFKNEISNKGKNNLG